MNITTTNKALVVVDVQNDFCASKVGASELVKRINRIIKFARSNNWKIFVSRDWHPKEAFEYSNRKAHCIQGTKGAEFHPLLDLNSDAEIISKGRDMSNRHYSVFNGDNKSLEEILKKNNITEIFILGLTINCCIKATVLDAIKRGFLTHVVVDACCQDDRLSTNDKSAIKIMEKAGVIITNSRKILRRQ